MKTMKTTHEELPQGLTIRGAVLVTQLLLSGSMCVLARGRGERKTGGRAGETDGQPRQGPGAAQAAGEPQIILGR